MWDTKRIPRTGRDRIVLEEITKEGSVTFDEE